MPSREVLARCPGELADALTYLRLAGCSPIQTIVVAKDRFGLGLADAKRALHQSPAWRDVAEAQERMWDAVLAELEAEEGQD